MIKKNPKLYQIEKQTTTWRAAFRGTGASRHHRNFLEPLQLEAQLSGTEGFEGLMPRAASLAIA